MGLAALLAALSALAGCSDDGKDSAAESTPVVAAPMTVVGQNLPSAALSVWGRSATDVYVVGADNGAGPLVSHYDGTAWTPLSGASAGDIWWVRDAGASTWMAGAGGRVLQVEGGTLREEVLDPTLTFFGIWGATADDVWAVGGNIDAGGPSGVWHYDGSTWSQATLPSGGAAAGALYKVWGTAADDVWAVGTSGAGIHWDGDAWSDFSTGSSRNLFTVHGAGGNVYAVGGYSTGTLVESIGGGAFADVTPDLSPQLNGVYAAGDGTVVAVGGLGSVYWRGASGWTADPREPATVQDLHATWIDPDGGVWAVGGHLVGRPLDQGVVLYDGPAAPAGM